MKPKLKRNPSHHEDICDAVKCKTESDIILLYLGIYEDGVVDFCDKHYKEYLEGIFDYAKEHEKRHTVNIIETDWSTEYKCEFLPKYASIEEYTEKTGKRFRMTKEQKERGLDRDGAFKEFCLPNE